MAALAEKSYTIGNGQIDGYVWIDYGEAEDKPEKPWKATGTATATVDNLFVRAEPNGEVIGELMKGNRFEINGITDGSWTQVQCGKYWCRLDMDCVHPERRCTD